MDIKEFTIKTSDQDRTFESGAKRDQNKNKGRFDLLSPIALTRLAQHTQKGAAIRGERNWEHGMPMSATLDSAIRHIYAYILKRLLDLPMEEDHLAAAMWNVMVSIHTEEMVEQGYYSSKLTNLFGNLGKPYNKKSESSNHSVEESEKKDTGVDKVSEAAVIQARETILKYHQQLKERYPLMEIKPEKHEGMSGSYPFKVIPGEKKDAEEKPDTIKFNGPEVKSMKKRLVMNKLREDLTDMGIINSEKYLKTKEQINEEIEKSEQEFWDNSVIQPVIDKLQELNEEKPEKVLCLINDVICKCRNVDSTCGVGGLSCEYQKKKFQSNWQMLFDECIKLGLNPYEYIKDCNSCIFSGPFGGPQVSSYSQCASCTCCSAWSPKNQVMNMET